MDRVGRRGKKEKPTSPSESLLPIKEGVVEEGPESSFPSRLITQGTSEPFLSGACSPALGLLDLPSRFLPSHVVPAPRPVPFLRPRLPSAPLPRPSFLITPSFLINPPAVALPMPSSLIPPSTPCPPSLPPPPSTIKILLLPPSREFPQEACLAFATVSYPPPTLSSSCLLLLPISHLVLGTFCALPPPSSSLPFPPHPSHASTSSREAPFLSPHSSSSLILSLTPAASSRCPVAIHPATVGGKGWRKGRSRGREGREKGR